MEVLVLAVAFPPVGSEWVSLPLDFAVTNLLPLWVIGAAGSIEKCSLA